MLRLDATPCPLILGADGTIRVKGSGVTLELIAGAFEAGATPEQIAHHCPSISLATIYSVISHLLSQHAEVQLYLRQRAQNRPRARGSLRARSDAKLATSGRALAPMGMAVMAW